MTNSEILETFGINGSQLVNHGDYDFPHLCLTDITEDQCNQVNEWAEEYEDGPLGCIVVRVEGFFDEPEFIYIVLAPMPGEELKAKIEEIESVGIH